MTLLEFAKAYDLPDAMTVNSIPVLHPESGEKIYIYSQWLLGFWYRRQPGLDDGPIFHCQFPQGIAALEVHPDALSLV